MRNMRVIALLVAALCLFVSGCSQVPPMSSPAGVVVIDIGHFIGAEGARTPGPVKGKVMTECSFWYQYSYYVKREIERAGYRAVICNRGRRPKTEPLRSYARRAGVVHLRHDDDDEQRYPSHYIRDRVARGMASADYAVYRRAAAAVFLHHNSFGHRWTNAYRPSLFIYNRYNGRPLAQSIAAQLHREVLDKGLPTGGRGYKLQARYVDADRAAGWMNTCDDVGIPAVVVEAAYLNNRKHAAFLADDANARRYAEAIGRGVVRYLRSGRAVRHVRADFNKADEGSFGYARESRRLRVRGAKRLIR